MASKFFPSLAATAFAAVLFHFFLKRRSREINGGEANKDAAANDGTARGDSGTQTSTEAHEMATSSGATRDAAANGGTARGDSGAPPSTEVPEVATSSGANKDAAANDGTARGDSGAHTSTEIPKVATSSGYDYEVFLSFRGPDTRSGFTDFLYTSMIDAGIRAFRDDEELRKGEEFAKNLLQAIKQSKILIPIFSKGYASSIWCLKELVQMVECQKNGRQKIIPIFYDVAPSEVRHQIGGYARAFCSHEEKQRYDDDTISEWKDALKEVSFLNGWDLHNEKNRQEGQFAKTVSEEVFNELKKAYLKVSDNLVNVDHQVNKVMERINAPTSDTQIIVIHGMGGIGKTTIAKIIYNRLLPNFKYCCYLSNIRETSKLKGIEYLQNQLISDILKTRGTDIRNMDEGTQIIEDRLSNKKVLLLLDDVEEENHVYALVGKHDWFGMGSKLIITARKKDVLPEKDCTYKVDEMDVHQSLQLFSKHAFRRDSPLDDYINQSNRAIGIAGGLPLALEVIGSLLSRTKKDIWDDILEKLETVPNAKIQHKLRISYDALEDEEKHIFLDIACLFIGYDKDILGHFWDASRLFPKVAMEVLENMSLIKILKNNKVWMHDQLRDLGREIVRRESNGNIKKQSRLWDPKQGWDLMRRSEGNKEVEALRVDVDRCTCEDFESLSDLRFLEVSGWYRNFHVEERLLWHKSSSYLIPTNENSDLLPQLLWLSWHNIPPTFEITNFSMENVVILDLFWSEITDDWKGWTHMEVMKNLKILDLSCCDRLESTPNLTAHSNLERLILGNCTSLTGIDSSIGHLEHLVSLDLSYCRKLLRLPDEMGENLTSLEYLSLCMCESLEKLPDTVGNLTSLIELDISHTGIKELPDSFGKLKNLKVMKMQDCNINKIPDAFWTSEKLEEIVSSINPISGNFRVSVNIGNCIYGNKSLTILSLISTDIYALPKLPESLIKLELMSLNMDAYPDLSNLTNLQSLTLGLFSKLEFGSRDFNGPVEEDPIPRWIGKLSKLEHLRLGFPFVTASPTDVSLPPRLKSLHLWCSDLRRLARLPSTLSTLDICGATITEIEGLGCLENLQTLRLRKLRQVKMLPDLRNLNKLSKLQVEICGDLVGIQGELPQSLERLEISYCESLRELPDLSSLEGLRKVVMKGSVRLNKEAISRLCSEKSVKFVGEEDGSALHWD